VISWWVVLHVDTPAAYGDDGPCQQAIRRADAVAGGGCPVLVHVAPRGSEVVIPFSDGVPSLARKTAQLRGVANIWTK
jgi:hypothetical protein